eukprot:COSAG03_NODE_9845_length_690_cov_1.106599_2_plen_45_part_01
MVECLHRRVALGVFLEHVALRCRFSLNTCKLRTGVAYTDATLWQS